LPFITSLEKRKKVDRKNDWKERRGGKKGKGSATKIMGGGKKLAVVLATGRGG